MTMSLSEQKIKELQKEIADMQVKLDGERTLRTEAEENSRAVTAAGAFVSNTEEQATGNTITVSRCTNPTVRDEKKQKFIDVEVPTYFYAIDLPPGAGISLSTNGLEYYHGQAYEVDLYTLADLKSRVARCWDHEKSISGSNENAYRRTQNNSLISAAALAQRNH